MKSLLIGISIVLLINNLNSQSGWEVQAGGTYGSSPVTDIFFIDDNTGWILSQLKIQHTTNGGSSWNNYVFTDTVVYNKYKVFFTDANSGWIIGSRLIRTTNSGLNWIVMDTNVSFRNLYFVNGQYGWLCGLNGSLKKTTNEGLSWAAIYTGFSENFNSVYFLNEQTGFIAADWGKIYRTTNGGTSWTVFYDNIHYSFMQSIKFINSSTGFICASGGNIFKTADGGGTWSKYITGGYSDFRDITFINSLTGFVCGSPGDVYKTINGGISWNKTTSNGLFAYSISIEKAGNGDLWLATDSGLVYKSSNYGDSWDEKYRQFFTNSYLVSIKFFNQTTGCICGQDGIILRTTNRGYNWKSVNAGINFYLSEICTVNQSDGYITGFYGHNNIVLKTTNAGGNWSQIYSDTNGALYSVFFINSQTGWVSGNRELVLKTTNSGNQWTIMHKIYQQAVIRDLYFYDQNSGYASYSSSGFLKTTNSGINWTSTPVYGVLTDMHFLNSQTGFVLGKTTNSGKIYKTIDGGNNWTNIFSGVSFNDLFFINDLKGWIVGYWNNEKIKFTSDAGVNWVTQKVITDGSLINVYFINDNEGWACGDRGVILHTTSGGIGINKIGSYFPIGFKLLQNYPNPFNPYTRLRFEIPVLGRVKLIVYDILGREIKMLVNENLLAGIYEVQFDGTFYPSGIYFCKMNMENYSETIKLVLIK